MINNLISNALAYNPEGTRIRVTVIPEDTTVRIEIADNGVGIPKELWSTIFDPFVRGMKPGRQQAVGQVSDYPLPRRT